MRGTLVLMLLAAVTTAEAGVTRVIIESKRTIEKEFDTSGQYELVTGHYNGELDPVDPHNRIVTDIQFAPRSARGMVEYSATFALAKPVDMNKASGVLFYDTPNRGSGQAAGDADGHADENWQGIHTLYR